VEHVRIWRFLFSADQSASWSWVTVHRRSGCRSSGAHVGARCFFATPRRSTRKRYPARRWIDLGSAVERVTKDRVRPCPSSTTLRIIVAASEQRALEFVAANVRRHRRAAGLTQMQLAEAIGVEPRFVQAIEAAQAAPSFKNLCALARALDLEVRDLFEPAKLTVRNPGRPPGRTS
jgi:DNA-binding XRE family transcriptional regulator